MNHRILLVCTEDTVCSEVYHYLQKSGYQIEIANDSGNILNMIRHLKPDLIIIFELSKTGLDIWKIAREIHQEVYSFEMFVFLILSPGHEYDYLKQPEKINLYDYLLVLPVDLKEILQGVEKLLK